MNNSNNFNVCEKCGTANPLIAKYCYQCGAHLRTPEDPIVCNNCNTVNSGSARYCKHCGNRLFRGTTVKICPRCNHTVNGDAYICERCGFEFVAMRPVQNVPQLPQNAGANAVLPEQKHAKKELRRPQPQPQQAYYNPEQSFAQQWNQPPSAFGANAAATQSVNFTNTKSGGVRVAGLIILLLSLAFLYFFISYYKIMPAGLVGVKALSVLNYSGEALSAGDVLWMFVEAIKSHTLKQLPIGIYVVGILSALFVISAFAMFLFGLVKLCTGEHSRKASGWCLFMFWLGVVVVGVLALALFLGDKTAMFGKFRNWLFGEGVSVKGGPMLWYSPVFFFVLFLFSLGIKRKKVRE